MNMELGGNSSVSYIAAGRQLIGGFLFYNNSERKYTLYEWISNVYKVNGR